MKNRAQGLPKDCPKPGAVIYEGRRYPIVWESGGYRLRSRSKRFPADFWTGATSLKLAQDRAKDWLERHKGEAIRARKGGGTLAALAEIYLATPKRTKANVAADNVSRLRSICRLALGKDLDEITCREITPAFWQAYQKAALEKAGHTFDLTTRHRVNIAINAATRAARCLFLPAMLRVYRAAGLDVHSDAGHATPLPMPYVPPVNVDDAALCRVWAALPTDDRLWLVIGLARFAGLRREEINAARVGWIEERNGSALIALRDRPEEKFWTKTGRPYSAQVIDTQLAQWLIALRKEKPADALLVTDPANDNRARWFERAPQAWLRAHGIDAGKPLHRLRGLYADHIAKLTADAVTARLAAVRAAQENLGHTTATTTERHYLSSDALR